MIQLDFYQHNIGISVFSEYHNSINQALYCIVFIHKNTPFKMYNKSLTYIFNSVRQIIRKSNIYVSQGQHMVPLFLLVKTEGIWGNTFMLFFKKLTDFRFMTSNFISILKIFLLLKRIWNSLLFLFAPIYFYFRDEIISISRFSKIPRVIRQSQELTVLCIIMNIFVDTVTRWWSNIK